VCKIKEVLNDDELGRIVLLEQFLNPITSSDILQELRKTVWSNHQILMFGKWVTEPRRIAFFGDPNISYKYSNQKMNLIPWTATLDSLKCKINEFTGVYYNSVLVNFYRDGEDYMGWHSDNEPELGVNPHICSLSLGQERDFILRLKENHATKIKIKLQSGDLLLMEDKIQSLWQHSLPKRKRAYKERINLTFRQIK
jgi:alkylated DNA repair dioxygenase AlkB